MTQEHAVKLVKIEVKEKVPAPAETRFAVQLWIDENTSYSGWGVNLLYALDESIRQMLAGLEMATVNGQTQISGWQFLPTNSGNQHYRIWFQVKTNRCPSSFDGVGETEFHAAWMALTNCYRSLFGINLMAKI